MDQALSILNSFLVLLFILFCLGLILFYLFIDQTRGSGTVLRGIPAFSHFKREVDLAVEAGKRLHISLGRGNINDLQGGSALIGLTILDRCSAMLLIATDHR